jgi:hypothetical protein
LLNDHFVKRLSRKDLTQLTITPRILLASFLAAPVLVGVSLLGTPAAAQAPAPSGRTTGSPGLDLSASQRAKADARQAQFKKDYAALAADPKLTDTEKQIKAASLYQAMDKEMLAILTPGQREKVVKQRQINSQFKADVLALQANKTLTDAQKKARYIQLAKNARNASLALMTPAQRADALKRSANVEQAQSLGQQLQKSETPAQAQKLQAIALSAKNSMQAVIADKTLSDQAKTAKIDALRKDALSRDLVLLTPKQRSLYTHIQALVSPTP